MLVGLEYPDPTNVMPWPNSGADPADVDGQIRQDDAGEIPNTAERSGTRRERRCAMPFRIAYYQRLL
jgi:hypothetical protein